MKRTSLTANFSRPKRTPSSDTPSARIQARALVTTLLPYLWPGL
ncbi:MAG: hypothetical protein RBU30_22105 [Polyangia bacterium]|nr:hypothetical protein [Polyangia bacterium]